VTSYWLLTQSAHHQHNVVHETYYVGPIRIALSGDTQKAQSKVRNVRTLFAAMQNTMAISGIDSLTKSVDIDGVIAYLRISNGLFYADLQAPYVDESGEQVLEKEPTDSLGLLLTATSDSAPWGWIGPYDTLVGEPALDPNTVVPEGEPPIELSYPVRFDENADILRAQHLYGPVIGGPDVRGVWQDAKHPVRYEMWDTERPGGPARIGVLVFGGGESNMHSGVGSRHNCKPSSTRLYKAGKQIAQLPGKIVGVSSTSSTIYVTYILGVSAPYTVVVVSTPMPELHDLKKEVWAVDTVLPLPFTQVLSFSLVSPNGDTIQPLSIAHGDYTTGDMAFVNKSGSYFGGYTTISPAGGTPSYTIIAGSLTSEFDSSPRSVAQTREGIETSLKTVVVPMEYTYFTAYDENGTGTTVYSGPVPVSLAQIALTPGLDFVSVLTYQQWTDYDVWRYSKAYSYSMSSASVSSDTNLVALAYEHGVLKKHYARFSTNQSAGSYSDSCEYRHTAYPGFGVIYGDVELFSGYSGQEDVMAGGGLNNLIHYQNSITSGRKLIALTNCIYTQYADGWEAVIESGGAGAAGTEYVTYALIPNATPVNPEQVPTHTTVIHFTDPLPNEFDEYFGVPAFWPSDSNYTCGNSGVSIPHPRPNGGTITLTASVGVATSPPCGPVSYVPVEDYAGWAEVEWAQGGAHGVFYIQVNQYVPNITQWSVYGHGGSGSAKVSVQSWVPEHAGGPENPPRPIPGNWWVDSNPDLPTRSYVGSRIVSGGTSNSSVVHSGDLVLQGALGFSRSDSSDGTTFVADWGGNLNNLHLPYPRDQSSVGTQQHKYAIESDNITGAWVSVQYSYYGDNTSGGGSYAINSSDGVIVSNSETWPGPGVVDTTMGPSAFYDLHTTWFSGFGYANKRENLVCLNTSVTSSDYSTRKALDLSYVFAKDNQSMAFVSEPIIDHEGNLFFWEVSDWVANTFRAYYTPYGYNVASAIGVYGTNQDLTRVSLA